MGQNDTATRIIKNTGFLYAKMGITMFLSLLTTRIILNSLGDIDFGIFNIVGGAIAMLGFINAALASATQRFMSYSEGEGNREKLKSIFNVSILLHFSIALVVAVVLLFAGRLFFGGLLDIPQERVFAARIVYASLIVSTAFTVMTVPYDAVLNAHENMKYYAIVGIAESVLKLSVALLCVSFAGDKLILYGVLMACIPLVTLTIMRIYCHKNYSECVIAPFRYCRKNLLVEMSTFSGWNFLTTATSMVTQYGMGVVINHYFGLILNAAFGIANQLSGMLMAFSSNAQKAFNPVLVKSEGAKNRNMVQYMTLMGCRVSFFIFGFFSIPAMLLMPELLKLWLGHVPDWAVLFCRLQLLRTLLEQVTISLKSAIEAQGNIKNYTIVRSVFYILPIVILPLMLSNGFAPVWVYIVWIVCWCVIGGAIALFSCSRLIDLKVSDYLMSVLLPSIVISSVSCAPFMLTIFTGSSLWSRLFLTFIQVLLFVTLSFRFLLSDGERMSLKLMITSITRR